MWRFPVLVPATVAGLPAQCIDLHQEGGAFLVARGDFAINQTVDVTIECQLFDGEGTAAHGQLEIRSIRPVSESATSLRVSGVMHWLDSESQSAVIEMCYVTEPYAARQDFWVQRAPRLPINLKGTLAGQSAQFIDISEHGAGCVVAHINAEIGTTVPISITLPTGESVSGYLEVRSINSREGNDWRVGGITTWHETGWLKSVAPTRSQLKAKKRVAST
jgi:hypothetical protein